MGTKIFYSSNQIKIILIIMFKTLIQTYHLSNKFFFDVIIIIFVMHGKPLEGLWIVENEDKIRILKDK